MSALNNIKGLILSEMKSTNPELKKAITRVINSIDSDLDTEGYKQSSDVDEALDNLDQVLCELDETQTNNDEGDIVIQRTKTEPTEQGYKDLNAES